MVFKRKKTKWLMALFLEIILVAAGIQFAREYLQFRQVFQEDRYVEPNQGVEVEIQKAYPGAHDIEVIHAANGFNKRLCCVQVKFKVGNPANSALYSEKVETLLFLRVDRGWLPVSKSHSSIIQPLLVNLFIAECDFVS